MIDPLGLWQKTNTLRRLICLVRVLKVLIDVLASCVSVLQCLRVPYACSS